MSQVTLDIGSGNSCNHGLFAWLPVPTETFWYKITSVAPPFAEPILAAAEVSVAGEYEAIAAVVAKSTTPSCNALSNNSVLPNLEVQNDFTKDS